jgi:ATP-dependent Clp protease ATP-binding subunit ClpA
VLETRHRISRLTDEAARSDDPLAALQALRELRAKLEEAERERVREALHGGSSFGTVAKALGISRQAAHRRYRDLAPASVPPLELSSQARHAIQLARDEAIAEGSAAVASEHLLLGVLRSGGGPCRALEAEGITPQALRSCLRTAEDPPGGPVAAGGRAVLTEAAQIARARHTPCVEAEHIVLAALNGPDGGALRAITALGVTPAAVRERLGC